MTTRRGPFRLPRLLCAVACAAVVLSGCGSQPFSARPSAARTSSAAPAASPRQRAVTDAARIMASFPRPPGAVRTGPIASLTRLFDRPATPDLASVTRWWRMPGRPQAALAWIGAHLPSGFTPDGTGTGNGLRMDTFALPAVPGVLTQRSLLVEVMSEGARTAVRADAQVIWQPPRPASERIPPGATVVTIARLPASGPGPASKRPAEPPVTITDRVKVARIAAAVDGLSLYPPGEFSCPADFGGGIRLTFRASGNGPVLALVTSHDTGCQGVSLVIGGKGQPQLAGAAPLRRDVLAIAGLRWQ
jgi:hypothetical protein